MAAYRFGAGGGFGYTHQVRPCLLRRLVSALFRGVGRHIAVEADRITWETCRSAYAVTACHGVFEGSPLAQRVFNVNGGTGRYRHNALPDDAPQPGGDLRKANPGRSCASHQQRHLGGAFARAPDVRSGHRLKDEQIESDGRRDRAVRVSSLEEAHSLPKPLKRNGPQSGRAITTTSFSAPDCTTKER